MNRSSNRKTSKFKMTIGRNLITESDGKRISDQNERIRSTQVCKELTVKYGLYFAGGKENVKRHRLREPDKAKYEIYDALKSAVPRANCWQELAVILAKEGIAVEFKTKGTTAQIEGVKFTKNGYSFSGSKIDKLFSYSKIDIALRQNSHVEQQPDTRVIPVQSLPEPQKSAPADFCGSGSGLGGLFDDLLASNPANDAEEDEFRRRMQRKKKRQRRI